MLTPQSDTPAPSNNPQWSLLGLKFHSVSLESGEIAYIDEGTGPPILLLHGAPLTALGFLRVVRELRTDHRVIAPDFPGFGASIAAPNFVASLEGYSRFVEQFCRRLRLEGFVAYVNDSSACIGLPALGSLADGIQGIVVASTVPLPLTGRIRVVKFALKHVLNAHPVRYLNRRLNLLPWLVTTVAPLMRPFPPGERGVLLLQFDTPEKRDRILDIFFQMGRDDAFMLRAAASARKHFADTPVLLLYGQFDPMRLIGAIPRFKTMFRNHTVEIIPFEEHFPILASGERVGRTLRTWIQTLPKLGKVPVTGHAS